MRAVCKVHYSGGYCDDASAPAGTCGRVASARPDRDGDLYVAWDGEAAVIYTGYAFEDDLELETPVVPDAVLEQAAALVGARVERLIKYAAHEIWVRSAVPIEHEDLERELWEIFNKKS